MIPVNFEQFQLAVTFTPEAPKPVLSGTLDYFTVQDAETSGAFFSISKRDKT